MVPNNFRRLRGVAIAAAVVASLALSSCAAASGDVSSGPQAEVAPGFLAKAGGDAENPGKLTVQLDYDTAEVQGLDPQPAEAARSWMIMGLVYETLVTVDENFEIQPELATAWSQPDPTTYVFTLDTDAKFSNGRALTPADVVGSINRLLKTPSIWTGQLGPVESVEETAPNEVTVRLASPHAPFLAALANTPAAILPMAEIEDGSVDVTKEMLGTGPFVVEEHKQDTKWLFTSNTVWRGGDNFDVKELELQIVKQETTRQASLREGSAGLTNFVSVDSLTQMQGAAGVSVVNQLQSDYYYVLLNSQRPGSPLEQQDVRFAINAAIDRQAIADIVFAGTTSPTGVTPSTLPGACDPTGLPSATTDVSKAKSVIEAAELGSEPLKMLVYTDEPVLTQIAQLIQQQLAEIGVTTEIEQYDGATYNNRVFTTKPGNFDLAIGWFAGYVDTSSVTQWWNPSISRFSDGFAGSHDDLNELIAAGAAAQEPSERAEIFTRLCATADEYSEMVPLVHRPSIIGFNSGSVDPTIQSNEGYGDLLRNITDYRLTGK